MPANDSSVYRYYDTVKVDIETDMIKQLSLCALCFPTILFAAQESSDKESKKLADDPTKITTKVGVSYTNNYDLDDAGVNFSASLAFDPVRKLNVRVNEDASDWRVGGSWLFDVGIVNFNFGMREFDTGAKQNNYSLGTFIPLSSFDIAPFGMQIFPMAGYTYNDGDVACEIASNQCPSDAVTSPLNADFVLVSNEAHTGYVGTFVLKPLDYGMTLIMIAAASAGSNDYSGTFVAGGLGYTFLKQHSVNAFTVRLDNSYGEDTFFGFTYNYEF